MKCNDVGEIMRSMGFDIGSFYCSTKVSWKLAEAIDWLHGAITEALTRPDTRTFYLVWIYYELLHAMAVCHKELAEKLVGKTPYQAFRDGEILNIIEKIKKW